MILPSLHVSPHLIFTTVVLDMTVSSLAGFRNSDLATAGDGFGENLFGDCRTIRLMKLTASTILPLQLRAGAWSSNNSGQVVHTHVPL